MHASAHEARPAPPVPQTYLTEQQLLARLARRYREAGRPLGPDTLLRPPSYSAAVDADRILFLLVRPLQPSPTDFLLCSAVQRSAAHSTLHLVGSFGRFPLLGCTLGCSHAGMCSQ